MGKAPKLMEEAGEMIIIPVAVVADCGLLEV
jgi:hypothetical protein